MTFMMARSRALTWEDCFCYTPWNCIQFLLEIYSLSFTVDTWLFGAWKVG